MSLPRRSILAGLIAIPAIIPAASASMGSLREEEGPLPDVSGARPPVPAVAAAPAPMAAAPVTPTVPAQAKADIPTWRRNAIMPPAMDGKPAITVMVDDMGWMHPHTEQAMALPGPLTLAWFPFAPRLPEQIAAAMARGHETMMHMPMQSFSNSIAQTGPDPLRIDLPPEVNLARLKAAIAAVPNSVGLNNHMGSVATKNAALMTLVAAETKANTMLFVDSIVVGHSQGLPCAEAAGVPAAGRDVFIDYKNDPVTIAGQLAQIEAISRRTGHVLAIGHPRPHTLAALAAWLPTLPGKGFALWPVSATVAWRNRLEMTGLHAA